MPTKSSSSTHHLFDLDRASLLTEIVVRVIRDFHLELSELHNDSTTVTFFGAYRNADGRTQRGQPTVAIGFGKNKDHRPDLKQHLWNLTATVDGMVSIHYRVYDGRTNDAPTHWDTWTTLRGLVGRSDRIEEAGSRSPVHKEVDMARRIGLPPTDGTEDANFERSVLFREPQDGGAMGADGLVDSEATPKMNQAEFGDPSESRLTPRTDLGRPLAHPPRVDATIAVAQTHRALGHAYPESEYPSLVPISGTWSVSWFQFAECARSYGVDLVPWRSKCGHRLDLLVRPSLSTHRPLQFPHRVEQSNRGQSGLVPYLVTTNGHLH